VRQCLGEGSTIQSAAIRNLVEELKDTSIHDKAHQQLECITAIATNIPRPGHSVVGQKTHSEGAHGWEAVAREFALLDYTTDELKNNVQLSEECLLYRHYTENCHFIEIELLADTSAIYLSSAGGAMARFILL
jgi:hypothetical protein